MKLELAEGNDYLSEEIEDNYTFVPGANGDQGLWVRDDEFDHLSNEEFEDTMNVLEECAPGMGAGLSGRGRDRRKARREAKRRRREERRKLKAEKKKSKIAIRLAKSEAIKSGKFESGAGGILKGVTGIASQIFGGGRNGGAEVMAPEYDSGTMAPGGVPAVKPPKEEVPFFKNPLVLIGGAVVIGGILFFATRKKK